jgi:hypothetical protein
MEAQLDFTWKAEPVIWKPTPQSHQTFQEKYELPDQLDFRLAEMPSIPSEKPVPLSFTNGGKKLVQYPGPSKVKPKSNIPLKPKTKNPLKPKPPSSKVIHAKPEWNTQNNTLGLFDPGLSRKMPIEIKHAIKNDPGIMKKPKFYQDIPELPVKKTVGKANSSKNIRVDDNLDVKFIADQEEIVKNLEKQLEKEKNARKKLDEQFSLKMKEMEKIHKQEKNIEKVEIREKGRTGYEINSEKKGNLQIVYSNKAQGKERTHSALNKKSQEKFRKFDEFNERFGNVNEVPTHDVGPMVLKAHDSPLQSSKPISKQIPPVQEKILKPSIKSYSPVQNTANTDIEQGRLLTKITKTSQISPRQNEHQHKARSMQFESFDIPESDPVLNSMTAAMIKYKAAHNYSNKTTSPLISQVGAKYIAYYANELSEMLIDDILEDTVHDLQFIEKQKFKQAHFDFSKEAETHFQTILQDFEEEAKLLRTKHLKSQVFSETAKNRSKVVERILNDWESPEILIEDKRRDWTVEVSDEVIKNVRDYKKKFEEFQRVFAGGSDGKLWDIYAVVGDEIVDEVIAEVAKEYDESLEEFTDRFMNNEFS